MEIIYLFHWSSTRLLPRWILHPRKTPDFLYLYGSHPTVSFSRHKNKRSTAIKADSCSATLGHLVQAFTAADRPDPRLSQDGKLAVIWCHQLKGYKNLDPSKSPQQALPICILLNLQSTVITNIGKASSEFS